MVVDTHGTRHALGKAVGDISREGIPDLLAGGNGPERPSLWGRIINQLGLGHYTWPDKAMLVWHHSPDMERHLVSDQYRVRTNIEVVDIDRNGINDFVAVTDQGFVMFRAPDRPPLLIGPQLLDDVEVADLNADGDHDLVARNQHLFGNNDSEVLHLYLQVPANQWRHLERQLPLGERLKIGDMDGDGRPDVVVNLFWYRNDGDPLRLAKWQAVPYCPAWSWPHSYLATTDVDGDGRLEIVMAPAEPAGQHFRLSWCSVRAADVKALVEHVVDTYVEAVMHGVVAGDFNNDGRIDIASALMHQGAGPKEVAIYRQEYMDSWQRKLIATRGAHSIKAADVEGDGDLDLFGANWTGDLQPVELWLNRSGRRSAEGWKRFVVDDNKFWCSIFVYAGELDSDGLPDIGTGGQSYRHPASLDGRWARQTEGLPANNVAMVTDLGYHGRIDLLASTWDTPRHRTLFGRLPRSLDRRLWHRYGGIVWARNQVGGRFEILHNIAPGTGNFLQGVSHWRSPVVERVALSRHEDGHGVQMLKTPSDTAAGTWTRTTISPDSQEESLSEADVDHDGTTDGIQCAHCRRQFPGGLWKTLRLSNTPVAADQHRLVDFNCDVRMGVLVGDEVVSKLGRIIWYAPTEDPSQALTGHLVHRVIGPMILDASDVDSDHAIYIVVGEHNLLRPSTAHLFWYESVDRYGLRWARHVIHLVANTTTAYGCPSWGGTVTWTSSPSPGDTTG